MEISTVRTMAQATVDLNALCLAKSGRAVKLLSNKQPLQVYTSALYTPFGVKSATKEWSNFPEYYIDCSLSTVASSTGFKETMEGLDEKIQTMVKESGSLFSADPSTAQYLSIFRENGSYPKLIKLQMPRDKNGNFTTFFFDENKNKVQVSDDNINEMLKKGSVFRCIIECAKIYSYNGRIGSVWNIVQLKLSENKKTKTPLSAENTGTASSVYTTMMID